MLQQCTYITKHGQCEYLTQRSKGTGRCWCHENTKAINVKCLQDDCKNYTASTAGYCHMHGQNRINTQKYHNKKVSDGVKVLRKHPVKYCVICSKSYQNKTVHNRGIRHIQLTTMLQDCECPESQIDKFNICINELKYSS